MKKNLLFVMPSLAAGGGEKSLINLLYQIDYDLYNVDLFLFSKTGTFLNSIPREVNILELPMNYKTFTMGFNKSLKEYFKNGKFNLAYYRLMFAIKNRTIKDNSNAEQYTWRYLSKSIGLLEKKYDIAIGYLEKSSIYFVVDKVNSKKKIGWIHTNYTNSGLDSNFDAPYLKQLDHIVTVSKECAESIKETFQDLSKKVRVIYNIVSPRLIKELSNHSIHEALTDEEYTNIVTVSRLSHEKGIDLAVKSCEILLRKGYKVRWYIIGEGNERRNLERLIEKKDLKNNFKLLGIKENPYPYIRMADIYVQPSRYEGKSIAIDEAKILLKPIIVTNFNTAKDQIIDGTDGVVVDINEEEISNGIERLIINITLTKDIINNLSLQDLGTEEEVKKLYEIF
ncbi:glycosyltransferase [Cytobacillus sp. S13-E01]|uniref:glycosyltransferase n=1 Tax=Cytobacillus sp. S13-E01 TaxID=3031326 RepID=UPI0023D7FD5A|nr:glycosyltransferase [Cytobacillus sp. S13-E01]MDF0727760.1 glycosyltransferase [Cytobacillus sp. S13-E01]